jgi:hypothetical protein
MTVVYPRDLGNGVTSRYGKVSNGAIRLGERISVQKKADDSRYLWKVLDYEIVSKYLGRTSRVKSISRQ